MMQVTITARKGFEIIAGSSRAQAATMVLEPGESLGNPENQHRGSEQWLFVLAGNGRVSGNGEPVYLSRGMLLLIEAGESHKIFNTGEEPLETLNIYVPPEY